MTFKETAEPIVQIDEHNLDRECIRLPGDYLKYAWQAAEAKRDVDEAKAALEVIDADLAKQIRDTPARFGLEKVTESAISGTILLAPAHKQALQILQDARHDYEMTNAVVWALDHKKRSLTLLVDLHGMGYFSDVKMSAQGKEAVQKMTQAAVRRSPRREDE
jgi:hypothetical protein